MRYALLPLLPLPPSLLPAIAAAYRVRGPQVAAAWPDAPAPADVVVVGCVAELGEGDVPFLFSPTMDPIGGNDLAFHFTRDGRPYGFIWCPPGIATDRIEALAGHEMAETQVDPLCTATLGGWALEIADPLQGVPDPVVLPGGRSVAFEATALPAWYEVGSPWPYDSVGVLVAGGTVAAAGYMMRSDGGPELLAPGYRHEAGKAAWHGRRARRARHHHWQV